MLTSGLSYLCVPDRLGDVGLEVRILSYDGAIRYSAVPIVVQQPIGLDSHIGCAKVISAE